MIKFFNWLFIALAAIAIFVLQRGLIDAWPYAYNHINLVLISLIAFLFLLELKKTLIFGLFLGILLDVFSFNFFGVSIVTIFLTLLFSGFMLDNWLTHRSAYSFLALSFFATIFYNIVFYFLIYVTRFLDNNSFFLWSGNFWFGLFWELLWNSIIIFAFFVVTNLTSNRLKLVFLEKK